MLAGVLVLHIKMAMPPRPDNDGVAECIVDWVASYITCSYQFWSTLPWDSEIA